MRRVCSTLPRDGRKREIFFTRVHEIFTIWNWEIYRILKLDATIRLFFFCMSREQISMTYIDHMLCLVPHLLNYLARRLLFIRLDIRLNRLSDHSPAYIDVVFYLNANSTWGPEYRRIFPSAWPSRARRFRNAVWISVIPIWISRNPRERE